MKRFICALMLITILLSCCACGNKPAAQTQPTETLDPASPEVLYGHVDQFTPIDGYYQIWNKEGIAALYEHPDAKFLLLCHVDMGGQVLEPIPEFTGELDGKNCNILNFTVKGGGENFGFISVNKGYVHNLYLDQVTYLPENATNMGGFAGRNEGQILRCSITNSTMTVESAAEGANCGSFVGISTTDIINTNAKVDITYNAPQKANIGGVAGTLEGCALEYVEVNGKLTIKNEGMTAGLMAGIAKNATFKECAFLGADNSQANKMFYNYFGTEEEVTYSAMYWRDNSRAPEKPHIQEKREKVVNYMYEMATIVWYPDDLPHTCNCTMPNCNSIYSTTFTYYGIPYNHKGGSLARMKYCLNEDGTLKDWIYELGEQGTFDTFDLYMGNDCSTAVQQAWLTVSNKIDFQRSSYQNPAVAELRQTGIVAVGEWEWDLGLELTGAALNTDNYTKHNGEEVMFEAYAQLRMGDGLSYYSSTKGGHSRLLAEDPVVVRDENGKISGEFSYVICHEQGVARVSTKEYTYSDWRTYRKYAFDALFGGYYIPTTVPEFQTGVFDEPTCVLEGAPEQDTRFSLTTGTVKANYSLDYVTMTITDSQGNVVFDHWIFPTATKRLDNNSNDTQIRNVIKELDLIAFAVPLKEVAFQKGETYRAVITGNMPTGDSFVVKDFSFTNG